MVTEAEVFDQVGDRAGGGRLPMPQGAVLTLLGQALPDAGARLVDLKRALPVQVSPSVIFSSGLKVLHAMGSAPCLSRL